MLSVSEDVYPKLPRHCEWSLCPSKAATELTITKKTQSETLKIPSIHFTSIPVVKKRCQCVKMVRINHTWVFHGSSGSDFIWEFCPHSAIPALQGGNKHCFSIPFPSEFMTTFHSLWHQYPTQKGAKANTPEDGRFELSQQPFKKPSEPFLCF